MVTVYVTFGQNHRHEIDGKVLDKDCVGVFKAPSYTEARDALYELFNGEFCFDYPADRWDNAQMKFFPRGFITIN